MSKTAKDLKWKIVLQKYDAYGSLPKETVLASGLSHSHAIDKLRLMKQEHKLNSYENLTMVPE